MNRWSVVIFTVVYVSLPLSQPTSMALDAPEVARRYPHLQERPFGRGIFAHVRRASGKNPATSQQIAAWANNPSLAGTQLSYTWAELEPQEGAYRWDLIEQDMEPWATAGKKVWIEIATASKRVSDGSSWTPEWVFQQGVPKIQAATTGTYPVFWNAHYLELWGRFIRAFAKRFDGDPRLEFVSTGGYANGHEPNLSAWDNDALMSRWTQAGFDGFTTSGIYLKQAIIPVLTMFSEAFHATPVAQTIHVKTDFDHALNAFAARLHFILISNGLGLKNANAQTRQGWRERREQLGVKVGYAEWGPSGRQLDPSHPHRQKKKKRDTVNLAKLIDVYRGAIGDDHDPSLAPRSRISYLPFAERVPEVETEEEWQAALQWASAHLEE